MGIEIKRKTFLKKLTLKTNWYKKETKHDNTRPKTWGGKIWDPKPKCDPRTPSEPIVIPRTPGWGLTKILKGIETGLAPNSKNRVKIV